MPDTRIIEASQYGFFIRDGFPISPGHTLIISKRHVGSFFDLEADERNDMLLLLDRAKSTIDKHFNPDSYNIGINDGPTAGQTIAHLHIHLIPRYNGDCPDPRGGVRWIIPENANYWSPR